MDFKTLAETIENCRKVKKISPVTLAGLSGVSFRTVYTLKNGGEISFESLAKIAAGLGYELNKKTKYFITPLNTK